MSRQYTRTPADQRFWPKVKKGDGCWLWTGSTDSHGYGKLLGTDHRLISSHRFSWQLVYGPIAQGMVLDHLCRVRNCVRPSHLEPVTQRQNVLRSIGPASDNAVKTHCVRGHLFDEANTYTKTPGHRQCCRCRKEYRFRRKLGNALAIGALTAFLNYVRGVADITPTPLNPPKP